LDAGSLIPGVARHPSLLGLTLRAAAKLKPAAAHAASEYPPSRGFAVQRRAAASLTMHRDSIIGSTKPLFLQDSSGPSVKTSFYADTRGVARMPAVYRRGTGLQVHFVRPYHTN